MARDMSSLELRLAALALAISRSKRLARTRPTGRASDIEELKLRGEKLRTQLDHLVPEGVPAAAAGEV